jgi:hypothetical protein
MHQLKFQCYNGLNVYHNNQQKVIKIYQHRYESFQATGVSVCLSVGQQSEADGPQFGNRLLTVLYTTQESANNRVVGNHHHQIIIVLFNP